MSSKLDATFAGCKGECCRNPYKVCLNKYRCDHHRDSARAQAAADEWREAVTQSEANAKRLSDAESKRMNEWKAWR